MLTQFFFILYYIWALCNVKLATSKIVAGSTLLVLTVRQLLVLHCAFSKITSLPPLLGMVDDDRLLYLVQVLH